MQKEPSLDDLWLDQPRRTNSRTLHSRASLQYHSPERSTRRPRSRSSEDAAEGKKTGPTSGNGGPASNLSGTSSLGSLMTSEPDPTDFLAVYSGHETSQMGRNECLSRCLKLTQIAMSATDGEVEVRQFSRYRTQAAFSFIGCRAGYAAAITGWLFQVARQRYPLPLPSPNHPQPRQSANKRLVSILSANQFMDLVSEGLALYEHSRRFHIMDFVIANDIFEQRRSFIILLGGTSGTGKSTLASILAGRLGITNVLSTDSIRHTLRSVTSKEGNPCLFVSTYEAGELYVTDNDVMESSSGNLGPPSAKRLHKRRILKGYMLQSRPVLDKLENILTTFEQRNKSLIVEGVHLSMDVVTDIMKRHPCVIPFLIHISNEKKHRERFAVRSRNMTLSPKSNKYIKYFDNINCIQKMQRKMAQSHLIPTVDNTNVDRSVALIHSTIVRVLRRISDGRGVINEESKCVILSREFERLHQTAWSSKSMRAILQQKVSKRILLNKLLSESPGADGASVPTLRHTDSSTSSEGTEGDDEDEEEEKLEILTSPPDSVDTDRRHRRRVLSPCIASTEPTEVGSLVDPFRAQDLASGDDELVAERSSIPQRSPPR